MPEPGGFLVCNSWSCHGAGTADALLLRNWTDLASQRLVYPLS
jgi:hypothetical protein